jgi:hypothetical protein
MFDKYRPADFAAVAVPGRDMQFLTRGQYTMKEKRSRTKEADGDIERRWQVMVQSKPKTSPAISTLLLVLIFAALCAAVYLNRVRLGALWRQVTGKAPPSQVMPEKPEREGPEIEGRDF